MQKVQDFMLLDEIFKYAAEPGANPEDAKFSYDNKNIWLTYTENNELLGLIRLQMKTNTMCEFHPYILKKVSRQYIKMVHKFYGWFFSEMKPEFLKLNAVIATCWPSGIRAAKLAGMTVEGVDRMSYTTDTGIYDRIMFGITRKEAERWATL